MINWIVNNKEWIFSGVGAVIIGGAVKMFLLKDNDSGDNKNKNSNVNKNIITINNGVEKFYKKNKNIKNRDQNERKKLTNILFVDDDTTFRVVKILIRSGWKNTKIRKNIISLDDRLVVEAHICFIDIQGVAGELFPKDQGLGLAGALKERYPEKKIVVYSSQRTGDRFHEILKKVDATLAKDADPYEFENLVDNYSEEVLG